MQILNELAKRARAKLPFIDGSYVRVHQDGATSLQVADSEWVATSRGGLNSKLHALVDLHGRPLKLLITPGNDSDIIVAPEVIAGIVDAIIVADKGYECAAFRTLLCAAENG